MIDQLLIGRYAVHEKPFSCLHVVSHVCYYFHDNDDCLRVDDDYGVQSDLDLDHLLRLQFRVEEPQVFYGHYVHGDGPGLVGGDDCGTSEGFKALQLLDVDVSGALLLIIHIA